MVWSCAIEAARRREDSGRAGARKSATVTGDGPERPLAPILMARFGAPSRLA